MDEIGGHPERTRSAWGVERLYASVAECGVVLAKDERADRFGEGRIASNRSVGLGGSLLY